MKPKVTIAIPAYNRPEYLRQAIRSALGQTLDDFEVIVCDDCSTDDIGSVANSFGDARIKYHRNASRLGAAKNHQLSVELARGEYITNLHSDDLLLPTYVEAAGRELDRSRGAAAVYSSMAYLIGSKIMGCQTVPKVHFANRYVYLENPWLEKFHNVVPTCCMFRRSAFDEVGGYRLWLRFAYDWDLFMRFMRTERGVLFLPEVLSVYRRHEEQASQTSSRQGLYDVLDLWKLDEYSHWLPSEIADLVFVELRRAKQDKSRFMDVLSEVGRRGVSGRILRGVPEAFRRRLRRKNRPDTEEEANYESPVNLESASRAANVLIGN